MRGIEYLFGGAHGDIPKVAKRLRRGKIGPLHQQVAFFPLLDKLHQISARISFCTKNVQPLQACILVSKQEQAILGSIASSFNDAPPKRPPELLGMLSA
ncbi:MAG: hypothetical protein ACJ8GW_17945 [Massilia sp.]